MNSEKPTKKEKLKAFITKRNLVITALIVFFAVQFIQIQTVLGTFSFLEGRDSSLLTEIGQIKEAYLTFGNDLNEMREFLRMPKKNYLGIEENADFEDEEDKNKNDVQLALFKYVDFLGGKKRLEDQVNTLNGFVEAISGKEFGKFLKEMGMSAGKIKSENEDSSQIAISDQEGDVLNFYLDKTEGVLWQKSIITKEKIDAENGDEFIADLKEFLQQERGKILESRAKLLEKQTQIAEVIDMKEVIEALKELKLSLKNEFGMYELNYKYPIFNNSGAEIGAIVIDPLKMGVILEDKKNADNMLEAKDLQAEIIPFLKKLDAKTLLEKKYQESLGQLTSTIQDKGFQLLLKQSGYAVSEMREDEDRVYFDLYDGENKVSSIVIEKATGVVNIVQPDGSKAENLLFFDPEFKKKTLDLPDVIPDYGDEVLSDDQTFNILIAGKHGSLLDTMIVAHIDENRGDVRMISIPRDLFYNGRKINSFAFYYGMPELVKILGNITGYQVDKYILIDMYAFIDVVDLIGGVDITLKEAVVDPFYKTVDNGVAGTLHYEPGDYHLGGKEALRLARSRKTSSDFKRAERQQMIIEAIQTKARNFGFGDADTIYEIAKTVIKKTETDIKLDEAISYYFRYQNFKIASNDVMTSGNVLYVPPYITKENCVKLLEDAKAAGVEKPDCENENQAYTLLPRKDNWNIIKWFFREKFEGV
ncbi:LCP family protein [Candidatus Peregrinibacteria bacterium]|nr:LCP family protein [Candidatus Peregrinibacteria bacterium]